MSTLLQIYSATYSNVPVFEFVTSEGPIMRRKLDLWINATHILKIAKFPKARRTRILEKDIQTGIHDKVQGGYGKYQGTYVPLSIGAELARTFGVYDILHPIFDFVYVEGKLATPPPAPKHNHASASNIARRQLLQLQLQPQLLLLLKQKRDLQSDQPDSPTLSKRMKSENGGENGQGNGRKLVAKDKAKRVALPTRGRPPSLAESKTVPISGPDSAYGPSIGTFSSMRQDSSFSGARLPPLLRQDTERDALLIMASNMNVRQADLEADRSDDESRHAALRAKSNEGFGVRESDDDEFMSGKELFGSRTFVMSQSLIDRGPQGRSFPIQSRSPESAQRLLSLNGSVSGVSPVHQQDNAHMVEDDAESAEYFNALLNYLMEESNLLGARELPEKVLNPPQPLQKININRPIDDDGNTIFHWACSMANVGMIEFLLSIFSNFINSESKNFNGETPLMFLVQFRNSFQLDNFPVILDMLFDSILSVDKIGRTVLHHIALACDFSKFDSILRSDNDAGFKARKERFVNYYFEIIFAKIVEFPDYQLLQGDEKRNLEDKKEVISKFINHQDNDGNTAFHIVAHNLSKKCIKTFIHFHKFIDLSLRNHVNFSVEDYLASHNFVLRLENEDGTAPSSAENGLVSSQSLFPIEHTQSFDTQLHKTRMAMNFHHSTINMVTEKLSELSYSMDNELKQKDEKLHSLYKYFRIIGLEKFKSQKAVLQLFNLHYLVEDIAKDYGISEDETNEDAKSDLVMMDGSRDKVIQEEVSRLMNDLTFQSITTVESLSKALSRYKFAREKATEAQLNKLVKAYSVGDVERSTLKDFDLALRLQQEVLRRKELSDRLYEQESKVPLFAGQRDECKENAEVEDEKVASGQAIPTEKPTRRYNTAIADYPSTDKLYKYCKLVALSCGMSMTEAENSIDLIEQSLAKNANGG